MYTPIVQDLVLIGGGHSHAIVLKMLGMHPIPGVRLTLITDASDTPYSGMLPGHIAGFYSRDECHINLRSLANFAQAQLYIDRVVGLDLTNNKVICNNRPPVSFDVLSIDIGSTPATVSVPGALEYAIPAKPVPRLLTCWEQLTHNVTKNPQEAVKIAIVGGGVGGVELALSMQANLRRIISQGAWRSGGVREWGSGGADIHLFQRHPQLMPNNHQSVRRQIQTILQENHIQLHLGENVIQIEPQGKSIAGLQPSGNGKISSPTMKKGSFSYTPHLTPYPLLQLECESGFTGEYTHIFWVTQASAPSWLQASGLKTDSQGFILVDDTLQSLSHPHIFAAGDIATMVNHPRPKAGVFAVRQGKPLFTNLQRFLLGKSLQPYTPQKKYLSLIGTGDGKAIATRGIFTLPSHQLIWCWKDWIDRRFMERFRNYPQMQSKKKTAPIQNPQSKIPNSIMPCAGCGSKVGSTVLTRVLQRIQLTQGMSANQQDITIGLDVADDAAVIKVTGNQVLVQTVDYFRALLNDPYIFGQIATNHCLSDIFAMGAVPHSALAIATIPYGIPSKVEETLYQLLSGAVQVLNRTGASLIGGHTTEGAEIVFGLSCNGFADAGKLLRKGGMQPGEVLILTKALGTGTLFAADMRRQAKGRWIDGAVESMLLSNQLGAECLLQSGASACTDVTGFGLLGHLLEMVQASGVGVKLQLEHIPVLTGARETIAQGIFSSLHPENLQASKYISNLESVSCHPHYPLLFDPQTSGGLLASVPADKADDCIARLKALGYGDSCAIAHVIPLVTGNKPIILMEETIISNK
ncbi:MAG: selenide, water dikinase SelD [Calothrix sp. MO_167.B12]|nr:selenide, water dikinase SelD [Calothrix sp. MO_167.B12]